MISGGRCHGPGCTREARAGGWCGEQCAAAWERQFWRPQQPPRGSGWLWDAAEAAVPEVQQAIATAVEQTLADVGQSRIAHVPPGSLYEDIVRVYERMTDAPPAEPVKLTPEQWGALRTRFAPVGGPWWRDGALGDLSGVPIELVDDERESTPYLERRKRLAAAFRHAAREAARLPVSASAEFPQVASGEPLPANPQVGDNTCRSEAGERGWLAGWLHRVFGRTS